MSNETENVEYRAQFSEELLRDIVAFANTEGGTVYVGMDRDGNASGLKDGEYTRITGGIREEIVPDVTPYVKYTLHKNKVVRIDVSEGAGKPYFLKEKGMKPAGVFVRREAGSVPASMEEIRRMIRNSDGDVWEEERTPNQELTFAAAAGEYRKRGMKFSGEKDGIRRAGDRLYSNLAAVLADQCGHSVKVCVFGDEGHTVIRDRKEFTGSVITQLEDATHYLRICNRTGEGNGEVGPTGMADYPEEAVREALVNALVHRDYGYSGSVIVNVDEKEMEFVSLGGPAPGLTGEDLRAGICQPRNKNLAAVFRKLRLCEACGTGIRKIYGLYADCPAEPRIQVTANTFRIALPNRNRAFAEYAAERKPAPVTGQMRKILEYIRENGQITDGEVRELLGLKKTRAFTLEKQMRERGLIRSEGRGKEKKFLVVGC